MKFTTTATPAPQPLVVNEHTAAELLCLSVATLRKDRRSARRIPCVFIGTAVRYSTADLQAFVAAGGAR